MSITTTAQTCSWHFILNVFTDTVQFARACQALDIMLDMRRMRAVPFPLLMLLTPLLSLVGGPWPLADASTRAVGGLSTHCGAHAGGPCLVVLALAASPS